jgi:hypothetical protein
VLYCETFYPRERANLGYRTCTECGEVLARQQAKQHTIVPMHKSNYVVITIAPTARHQQQRGPMSGGRVAEGKDKRAAIEGHPSAEATRYG